MTSVPGRSDRRGFTLLELLAVLAILSLLAGIGLGVFAGLRSRHALPAAAGHVAWILRAARNFSLASGTPSRVTLDPGTGTVEARGFELVGAWRFEDLGDAPGARVGAGAVTEGALGARARAAGPIRVVKGKIGLAAGFLGSRGHLDCGRLARFAPPDGIAAEAWILWAGSGGGTVLRKEGSYELAVTAGGAVEARIGEVAARTAPGAIVPYRWTWVSAVFDGEDLAILVDGIALPWRILPDEGGGRPPLPGRLPVTSTPLTISGADRPFPGAIDEVVLRAAAVPRRYELPSEVRIVGWKRVVRYNARGELDPLFHPAPVRIVLALAGREEDPAPRKGSTSVGAARIDFGRTFAEWVRARREARGDGAPIPEEAAELEKLVAKIPAARRREIIVETMGGIR